MEQYVGDKEEKNTVGQTTPAQRAYPRQQWASAAG